MTHLCFLIPCLALGLLATGCTTAECMKQLSSSSRTNHAALVTNYLATLEQTRGFVRWTETNLNQFMIEAEVGHYGMVEMSKCAARESVARIKAQSLARFDQLAFEASNQRWVEVWEQVVTAKVNVLSEQNRARKATAEREAMANPNSAAAQVAYAKASHQVLLLEVKAQGQFHLQHERLVEEIAAERARLIKDLDAGAEVALKDTGGCESSMEVLARVKVYGSSYTNQLSFDPQLKQIEEHKVAVVRFASHMDKCLEAIQRYLESNGWLTDKLASFLQGFITPFQEILPQVQQSVMKNIPADSLKGKLLTAGFGGLESLLKQVNENSAKYAADVGRFVESAEQRISTALNKNVTAGSRTLDERKAP